MLKSLTLSVVLGLILGFGALAWVRPNTSPGAVVTVLFPVMICFALGGIARLIKR